jgi:tetratricopeptide (TPR) repeat protein
VKVMQRREILLNCLGGASVVLFPSRLLPAGVQASETRPPEFDKLLKEVRAACYSGWSRMDYGYPIPYFDHAWAQLPRNADSSVRAGIVEHRQRLLVLRDEAESSLAAHRAAVQAQPTNWEHRYWFAFALRRAGRNEEALEEYLTVAQTPGSPHDCLNEIGWCYYRKTMYEEARKCFERTKVQNDPIPFRHFSDLMRTLENRMLVYGQLGLRKQAEETVTEYVRRYGRIGYPERRALDKLGIDADAIYVDHFQRTA